MKSERFVITDSESVDLVGCTIGPSGGAPVLLLHGGGQTRFSWKRTAEFLSANGVQVTAYDARGHGESGWSLGGHYAMADYERDLGRIIDRIDEPIAIVGASLGGLTALAALREGGVLEGRASCLVLIDVVPLVSQTGTGRIVAFMEGSVLGFDSPSDAADFLAAFRRPGEKMLSAHDVERSLRVEGGRYYWKWDPQILSGGVPSDDAALVDAMGQTLRHFQGPVLLIRGEKSDVVGVEETRQFRELRPDAQIFEVPGMGHAVVGRQIAQAHEHILDFIRSANQVRSIG